MLLQMRKTAKQSEFLYAPLTLQVFTGNPHGMCVVSARVLVQMSEIEGKGIDTGSQ